MTVSKLPTDLSDQDAARMNIDKYMYYLWGLINDMETLEINEASPSASRTGFLLTDIHKNLSEAFEVLGIKLEEGMEYPDMFLPQEVNPNCPIHGDNPN